MNTIEKIKGALIKAGIHALKDYGYPEVDSDNITTDIIYSAFFKEMLTGSKGKRPDVDKVIDILLKEIKENQ